MNRKKKKREPLKLPSAKRQSSYFLKLIAALPADEFVGTAHILGVTPYDDDKNPRPFSEILGDVMAKFERLNVTQRHNLIWVIEAALSEDEEHELHADKKCKRIPAELLVRRSQKESTNATTSTNTH